MHHKSTSGDGISTTTDTNPRYPTRSCAHCGLPFTSRDKRQRFCSKQCVWDAARAKLQGMQEKGQDPTHGGAAAQARRDSLARRRAAGELIGRAAAKAKREGAYVQPFAAPPLTVEQKSIDWDMAGQTWAALCERLSKKEKGRSIVLAGYGLSLRVSGGSLDVKDGFTHNAGEQRTWQLDRATHGVERIVCVSPSGNVSLEALLWCREQGVNVTVMDRDGTVLSTLTPQNPGDIELRRAQYGAAYTGKDVTLCKWLVQQKVMGQRAALQACPRLPGCADGIQGLDGMLNALAGKHHHLSTVLGIMTMEARAAAIYFKAWNGYPLQWRDRDKKWAPPHWRQIRERVSPLTDNARKAVDPFNAALNYAYGVLEGQCTAALVGQGFDTLCGVLHADAVGRNSLVYDFMELHRPAVDRLVLAVFDANQLTRGAFVQTKAGQCRLHPQVARAVALACRVPQRVIDESTALLKSLMIGDIGV